MFQQAKVYYRKKRKEQGVAAIELNGTNQLFFTVDFLETIYQVNVFFVMQIILNYY